MSITSYSFLLFCGLVILLYFTVLKKHQWQLLLVSSLIFYASFSVSFLFSLVYTTVVSYFGALIISDKKAAKQKKAYAGATIILLLLTLLVFKYSRFLWENITAVVHSGENNTNDFFSRLVLPVGLSFYTFQAVSYCIDIYREEYTSERNIFKHALYISFFPQILQGPLSGYRKIKDDLFAKHEFDYSEAVSGARRFAFGLFKKLVIANRIHTFIAVPLSNYTSYRGIVFWYIFFLYAFEIYADFSGYMDIMAGLSKIMRIKLAENFDTPYLSKSIPEFWRRWHISLGEWFRQYLFYPILRTKSIDGLRKRYKSRGRRKAAKNVPTIIALVVVWATTGLWHGASWNYVLWGIYYGTLIILSTITEPVFSNWRIKHLSISNSAIFGCFRIVRTFVLVVIGYVLFRMPSLTETGHITRNMLSVVSFNDLGKLIVNNKFQAAITLAGIVILIVIDVFRYKKTDLDFYFRKMPLVFRWIVYFILIAVIILLGDFDAASFIYFGF